jgi:hypothetical protein
MQGFLLVQHHPLDHVNNPQKERRNRVICLAPPDRIMKYSPWKKCESESGSEKKQKKRQPTTKASGLFLWAVIPGGS